MDNEKPLENMSKKEQIVGVVSLPKSSFCFFFYLFLLLYGCGYTVAFTKVLTL
jgi:hypothetical protein